MRWLIGLVLAGAALWSGYWYLGALGIERASSAWFDERRAEGWAADAATIETSGYPVAFRTVLRDVALADPATGLAWGAPEFTFEAPTYAPTRITAELRGDQTLASPFERLTLQSEQLRADVGFAPGPSLTLQESAARAETLTLISSQGWRVSLGTALATTDLVEGDPLVHHLQADVAGFTPDAGFKAQVDPGDLLPDAVETLSLDVTATFDAPWDRFAVEDARPQPQVIELALMRGQWGPLDLRAAGRLEIDAEGVAEGRIDVKADNWREMLEIAVAAELLPRDLAPTIERALEVLAGLSGNPRSIDVPLSFQNGFYSLGPLPLGPAPRFRIR